MPNLIGREIFAAGTWNGQTYTEKDLDDMVEAFAALDFKPALKQGHVADETGLPALGYVDNLRRVGKKLVADFIDMPQEVADAISAKRFSRVSAEIFHNFKRAGNMFRRVLKAVALLGVEIPAVAGLKPLHEFASDDFESVEIIELKTQTEVVKMSDDILKAENEALKKRLDAAEQKISALSEENEREKAKAESFAEDVRTLKQESVKARVDAKLAALNVPALKEHFASLYSLALQDSKQVNFKDGESSLEAVIDELFAEVNKRAEHLFNEQGKTQEKGSGNAEADFDAEVKAYAKEHGVTYKAGMAAVKKAKPELYKQYVLGGTH